MTATPRPSAQHHTGGVVRGGARPSRDAAPPCGSPGAGRGRAGKLRPIGLLIKSALLGILALPALPALAQDGPVRLDWCERQKAINGWHFYCDPADAPEEEEKAEEPAPPPPVAAPPAPPTATEEMAAFRERLDEALNRAVLDPTRENMVAFMTMNKQASDMASDFAEEWDRVVWTTPALDYSLEFPVNSVGTKARQDRLKKEEDALAQTFSKANGLFFIFAGPDACPHCAQQADILESFARRLDLTILGVSTDGSTLPQFPDPLPESGQLAALGVQGERFILPAILMVNPKTGKVGPVSFGLRAESEILTRLRVLASVESGARYTRRRTTE